MQIGKDFVRFLVDDLQLMSVHNKTHYKTYFSLAESKSPPQLKNLKNLHAEVVETRQVLTVICDRNSTVLTGKVAKCFVP